VSRAQAAGEASREQAAGSSDCTLRQALPGAAWNGWLVASVSVTGLLGFLCWVKQLPEGPFSRITFGDTTLVPLVATAATENFPALSPDGRWLAYTSNESGAPEVYVRPFPATATAKWQVSTAGGVEPAWASTGRELLYINGKFEMVSAEIAPGATFAVGRQRTLFSVAQLARPGPVPSYAEPGRQAVPDGPRGGDGAGERADRGGELAAGAQGGGQIGGSAPARSPRAEDPQTPQRH
jgi:hypothetical protein